MESRARLFGHAIHPMLIVFPLGLLVAALAFDLVYHLTGNPAFATVAYWNIVGGVGGGLAAGLFGLIDWLAIPQGTRARAIGAWHGVGNVVVLALFAVSGWLRWESPGHVPEMPAQILAIAAVALGLVTSWLGGELVERLGIGVTPGAHPDAPSSLAASEAEMSGSSAPSRRRGGAHP
jgi:uncharacterized membrane protein